MKIFLVLYFGIQHLEKIRQLLQQANGMMSVMELDRVMNEEIEAIVKSPALATEDGLTEVPKNVLRLPFEFNIVQDDVIGLLEEEINFNRFKKWKDVDRFIRVSYGCFPVLMVKLGQDGELTGSLVLTN